LVAPLIEAGRGSQAGVEFVVTFDTDVATSSKAGLLQLFQEIGLADKVRVGGGLAAAWTRGLGT
jgi:hypothetical protein